MTSKQESYEEAVVAILLRNPETVTKHDINELYFQKWRNTIIAIKQVAASGQEVDILSVAQKLNRKDAALALNSLVQSAGGALANFPKYLEGLRDAWRSEQLKTALNVSLSELHNEGEVDAVISQLMQSTLKAATTDVKSYNWSIKAAMGEFLDRLESTFDARDIGGIGLKTGIQGLDKVLGGLHPSDMVVVGARPGMGKTSFATSVLMNIAKTGKRVGFVSSEMSASQVMLRITALESGIAGNKLRDANLQDEDWPLLTAATNKLSQLDIRIYDKPAITSADVMLQSKAWMIDGGIDFIAIDYLTRIRPVKSQNNQNLDVGTVVTEIKNIARSLNIPVMLLAQLNRDAAERKPIMSDLRDSGIIEQEADQILMLWRDKDDASQPAEIIIEKNRHGESMILVPCDFDRATMRWGDVRDWEN